MIITKKVKVRINNINKKHYKDVKLNDIIEVNVDELSKGSHVEIDVACDVCGKNKKMLYKTYIKHTKNDGKYYCRICNKVNTKKTNIERYGVEVPIQSKEIMKKINTTNLIRYGFKWCTQNNIIKEKQRKTCNERYGCDSVSLNYDIRCKQTLTKIKRIIKKYTNDEFISYDNDSKIITLKCCNNHIYEIRRTLLYDRYRTNDIKKCTICNPKGVVYSGLEKELRNFIEQFNVNKINNYIINDGKKYELDIYLPDYNLGIEFNGIFWHSDKYKKNDYHYNKTEVCLKNGIKLLHIYEDDWCYKKDIVKSLISKEINIIDNNINIKDCNIVSISDVEYKKFLDNNDIEGYCPAKIMIGLSFNDELVYMMSFSKSKIKNNINNYDLIRSCSKINTKIFGCEKVLLDYFNKIYTPKSITTYVNKSYNDYKLFNKLGFSIIETIKPRYFYVVGRIRIPTTLYKTYCNVSKQYNKIYDSGRIKMTMQFS
jgi:hypothetical protein